MAILTTGLPAYGFLDDLPDIIFSEITTSTAYVTVKFNGSALITSVKMTPDAKKTITIYAKQMIRNMVTLTKPNSCALGLPQLIVQIAFPGGGALSTSGYVILGNTNDLGIITQEWFAKNFLTWQQPEHSRNGWHLSRSRLSINTIYNRPFTPETAAHSRSLFSNSQAAPTFSNSGPTSPTYGKAMA